MTRVISAAQRTLEKFPDIYLLNESELILTAIKYNENYVLSYSPSPRNRPFKLTSISDERLVNLSIIRDHQFDFNIIRNIRELSFEYNLLQTIPKIGDMACSYTNTGIGENLRVFSPSNISSGKLQGFFMERREYSGNTLVEHLFHRDLLCEIEDHMINNISTQGFEKLWLSGENAREFLLQNQYQNKQHELRELLGIESKEPKVIPFRK